MIKISDTLLLGMTINDVNFPLELGSFDSIQLNSSVQFSVPVMQIKFGDPVAIIGDLIDIADGSEISITIGTNDDDQAIYNFRSYGLKKELISNVQFYTLTGYLDVPKYYIDSSIAFFKGTSSEALSHIASQAGMSFFGETTSDVQTWINSNMRHCNFIQYIVDHGYRDTKSIMVSGVTLGKSLRYIDFSNINYGAEHVRELRFGAGDGINVYPVSDFSPIELGGFYNIISGYRSKVIHQSITDKQDVLDTIEISPVGNLLNLSDSIRNQVEKGTVEYSVLDSTNVHDKFFEAQYQNRRGRMLQTSAVKLITHMRTTIELLDATILNLSGNFGSLGGEEADVNYDGKYVVTDKTVYANKVNYSEVFHVVRDGINV